jgi:protein TonB
VVEKDGLLTNMKIIQDPGYGTDKEFIRVMQLSLPWKAGQKNKNTVHASFNLPLNIENAY